MSEPLGSQDPSDGPSPEPAVRLSPGGMIIEGEQVPLWAASVHYWHLDPSVWRPCLEAVRELGYRFVDTYVPWSVHEIAPGQLDLGQVDPRKNVARFLELAHEVGLFAIVRPGPHINGELTNFGIPERVVWDPACQALGPSRNPVMLPMLPAAFPVPSYASLAFSDEVARWFAKIGEVLGPLVVPHGPIAMVQIDNEGALYFRDGAYDQDWHPDALTAYRQFLRDKYKTLEGLEGAYGVNGTGGAPRFGDIEPPTRFDAETERDLARHIDWAEFHEHLLATAMTKFADALATGGLTGIPRTHNFPLGQESTPLNAARVLGGGIDLVGLDYYGRASEQNRAAIARRTSELAVRSDALAQPAFACEMGAGFPPFFPPLSERDSEFTVLAALAYGLRGFNTYMVVERDRWIGAPIDPHGRRRPFAEVWRKLIAALDAVDFCTLRRVTKVHILTPRNERRIARVTHAFGPLTPAFFSVSGSGPREACLEDDFAVAGEGAGEDGADAASLGDVGAPAIVIDTFVRALEESLEARGVPFAHVGGEDKSGALDGARWVICATSGGLSQSLFDALADAAGRDVCITLGPRRPLLGGARRELRQAFDLDRLRPTPSRIPTLLTSDPRAIDAAVAEAITSLGLPVHASDPDQVYVTVHEDPTGRARLLFVISPGDRDLQARVGIEGGVTRAYDPFEERGHAVVGGVLEVRMRPCSVRMFVLERG